MHSELVDVQAHPLPHRTRPRRPVCPRSGLANRSPPASASPSMSGGSRPSPTSSAARVRHLEEELHGAGVRLPVHHLVLLKRVDADPVSVDPPEVARGHDVRVRPHTVLGSRGRSTRRRRDRAAWGTRTGSTRRWRRLSSIRPRSCTGHLGVEAPRGELGQDPVVRGLVVEHTTGSPDGSVQSGIGNPDQRRAGVDRAEQQAARLVVDIEYEIDHLDGAASARRPMIRVRRVHTEAKDVEVVRVRAPSNVKSGAGMMPGGAVCGAPMGYVPVSPTGASGPSSSSSSPNSKRAGSIDAASMFA